MRSATRVSLIALTAFDGWIGGWALLDPATFYRDFPGFGAHWVSAAPPYNEHLLTDFGGALLGLAVALGCAAILDDRRLTCAVSLAALVQSVPHLGWHLLHAGRLSGSGLILSRLGLTVPLLLAAIALLQTVLRPNCAREAAPPDRSRT